MIGGTTAIAGRSKTEYAEKLNRMIAATPNSNLITAVPTSNVIRSVKYAENQVSNIFIQGTTPDYTLISTVDFNAGRFFNEVESKGAANVCLLGYDVADALFPNGQPIDKFVGQRTTLQGNRRRVRGGSFLGLPDSIVIVRGRVRRFCAANRVKMKEVKARAKPKGADRSDAPVRASSRKKDDFNINEQQAFNTLIR
jgi:putative ABC transport system permease protein